MPVRTMPIKKCFIVKDALPVVKNKDLEFLDCSPPLHNLFCNQLCQFSFPCTSIYHKNFNHISFSEFRYNKSKVCKTVVDI